MTVNIIKKQSKQTYKSKDGKERHFYNYYARLENGKAIQIKPAFGKDYVVLDSICDYER